ncbi:hypothetical protein [Pedobacter sp. Leaf176]|uniref:hypothetical protein n=1 Tax=Pedobacter sp. Leaf176 TaxID=1736286 RepID=UPI0006FEE4F6|nr:hypothetical protein [Pedobacter sp. Leaf176]KQR69619.1 hypothetical protein ASF92_12950 [Pedobacter sp. Leaf176]
MNYKFLKVISLTIFLLFVTFFSNAQSNYFKWSYGFGAGANYSRTDVVDGNWGYTFTGNIDHHFTPFVTLGLEAQYGMIQGGDIVTDPNNRQFVNKYRGINVNLKIGLGEFIDYNKTDFLYKIKGLYLGTGLGAIDNKITDIVRYRPSYSDGAGDGPFPGKDESVSLWVPVNLGINFHFNDKWGAIRYVLNFNAQTNFTFGEGLDGYDDPPTKFENYNPDVYNVYSIGFKYYLGNTRIYRRTL